jgi:transcriptional regulator of acetoin/glycerol metabolism
VIICEDDLVQAEDLALKSRRTLTLPPFEPQSSNLRIVERETITRVLHETSGNKSTAAMRLGLSRTQLYQRLRKYGLADRSL